MSGFVSFVSSGPGDPELLTLKAVDRLARADIVLYDVLAEAALVHAGQQAELISVGKRAGKPSARQENINMMLVEKASAGAHVIRLKSGDSGVFGRLEEELLVLRAAGIPHEIIPGVPSACAAAAAAGIPLTRRLTSRRVQFITGADVTGDLPEGLNWAALADADATTAVFMGKRSFPALAASLIAHGLAPETPALLAESVSHPDQALSRWTIASLAERLSGDLPDQPALIIYGPLAGGAQG